MFSSERRSIGRTGDADNNSLATSCDGQSKFLTTRSHTLAPSECVPNALCISSSDNIMTDVECRVRHIGPFDIHFHLVLTFHQKVYLMKLALVMCVNISL